ncbi:MAG: transporter substrate-binding domain-containing protein [Anaerorhabdus sp.]
MRKAVGIMAVLMLMAGCSSSAPETTPEITQDVLTVGMECNYAPFNWSQAEATEGAVAISEVDYCDGYDVAMAQNLAGQLGMTLVVKAIAWEGLIPALNNGEIDLIIAGMTQTEERLEAVNFTTPYYESQMVMIVRASDTDLVTATSIQNFTGKKVLGQINTLYDDIIEQIVGVNHATPLATYPRMVLSLQQGEVDALTAELPVAQGVVAANPDLTIVTFEDGMGFVADTTVSIAVAKDNTVLLDRVQVALDNISEETRVQLMQDATSRQPAIGE